MCALFLLYLLLYVYFSDVASGTVGNPINSGFSFYVLTLLSFTLFLDIKMNSPPTSPPRPYGSSRMTGDILCGQALGNVLNVADFDDVMDVLHPISGKVLVYSSNQGE